MNYKKILGLIILYPLSLLAADSSTLPLPPPVRPEMVLDEINLQFQTRDWVVTQSALLEVHISATLNDTNMVEARNNMMRHLRKIAVGEWRMTRFDRAQDSSGLEKLEVTAEARVAQAQLTQVYQNAKSESRPGETYSIASIDFKPSFDEMQKAKSLARQKLYQQVQDEIIVLNKAYPTQHYSVHELWFFEGDAPSTPSPIFAKTNNIALMAASPTVEVSNELKLSVIAQVASNRGEK